MINPVARYRELVDSGTLAAYDSSVDGRLVACNEAFARLIGYDTVGEAIGCDLTTLYVKADRPQFIDRLRRERRVHNVRGRLQNRRGDVRHVLLTGIGDFDAAGELAGIHGYIVDITDLIGAQRRLRTRERELEERLAHSEKMETIGRLAGGIAHDFNNLLTAILGYSELLLAGSLGARERRDVEEIQRAGQRAASLTQQLLAFSRKQVLVPKDVDLNATVANLRTMLTRVIREDIRLTCDLPAHPAIVHIDPVQLEQALLNLVLNARDALPSGGWIRIEVGRIDAADAALPTDAGSIAADEYVRLRVSDNGVGIAPEAQAHLFEPFFTTKAVGKGTGLGLASVYGIVRQSNGVIAVDSEPGRGTTFTMLFPAVSAAASADAARPPAAVDRRSETILLVEDEDAVRTIARAALERHGYTVLEAATPEIACGLFDRHHGAIDLLLTDIIMPGMNGPALAQRFVGMRPDLRILFISGYADAVRPEDIGNPNVSFLGKPFQPSVLADRVRDVLARAPQANTRSRGAA